MSELITIKTSESKEIVDITENIEDKLPKDGGGICNIFVSHTTASITTADLDPGTDKDMLDAFERIIPDLDYRHPHDPRHVPDHIMSSIIGPSVSIPYSGGKLKLGTWQRVVLVELDGPRKRKVYVTLFQID